MKTANDLLQGILTTVVKIEQKMDKGESSGNGIGGGLSSKGMGIISGSLSSFGKVSDKTKTSFVSFMKDISDIVKKDKGKNFEYFSNGLIKISTALPALIQSLAELGKLRASNVQKGLSALRGLYEFMHEMGDGRSAKRVERAINLFDNMGKSLEKIAKPLKMMSSFLLYLALGIVAFAGALLVAGMILGLASPKDALLFVGFTIISIILMFAMIAMADKIVTKGSNVIKDIGIGMGYLSLGLVAFALGIKLIPMILGGESGGSITKSLFIMSGIVLASVLMFALIGMAAPLIKKGTSVVFMMSLGLVVLSASMIVMATAAKFLMGGALFGGPKPDKEKDDDKNRVLNGLGVIGLIFLASATAFALLGIPAVSALVLLGVGTSIAMSVALMVFGTSMVSLAKSAKSLQNTDLRLMLSTLVGGTINGLLDGFSVLTGGKSGLSGVVQFVKNSAKIFAGLGVLMGMSLTLSQFAKAITAFAELESMRVIEGYDKDGKPIFGEKVNISNVSANIATSISTFLSALITSTEDLTVNKAAALKKLGRALTGRRGILTAVNDFAEVIKTFSQFGPNGEIGYVEMMPNGTDADGNAIFKQVPKTVKITQVAKNIANSFGTFVDELVKHTSLFEISGSKGKSMMKLAEVLMGSSAMKVFGLSFGKDRPGLLAPITKFSEILSQYSSFGDGKKIPILDPITGKVIKTVDVSVIAKNIVNTLGEFSKAMGNQTVMTDTEKAEKNIGKFSDLMESTNKITESMDGLTKLSVAMKDLAEGIGSLAINVDKMNVDKLSKILDKTTSASARPLIMNYKTEPQQEVQTQTSSPKFGTKQNSNIDVDEMAQRIGAEVGARVAASLKNGHFIFEFDTTKSGGVYYWSPK